ncbi:hypothetical protein L9F63_004197 [Diploptera punctata]|uniref:Dynein axonemal assembly factor 1 homolog n=1 Tax=Diploptera punctata TaxID=6984 RepID=A0AAD8E803_DIPPU|nr:hypothetical protein L9F63_004197 [Diploptera punctata]
MTAILQDLEPHVIDTSMIMKALEEERASGEAGRLAAEEGIILEEVERLRLEFLNILKIDHLSMMTSLVMLKLPGNIIEKIEGLDALINLKELDLSFNNIEVIENLNELVKLEILTLFQNRIKKLENMDMLVKLTIFSIGNNKIDDMHEVIYMRQFCHLHSFNMAGNPCTEDKGIDFRQFICAYLPNLTYYEYRIITSEERQNAYEKYRADLEQLEKQEEKIKQKRNEQETRAKELVHHTEAFVENLDGDQLFVALFENDRDGKALLKIGDTAIDIFNNFHDELVAVVKQLFKVGIEQNGIRQEEIKQFYKCVDDAKETTRYASQEYVEIFFEKKAEIFFQIRKLLQTIDDLITEDEIPKRNEYITELQKWSQEYHTQLQNARYKLMSEELTLFNQIEEINGNFEQNINDLVAVFIESAQSFFVQVRNLESNYSEEITEVSNGFLTNLNISSIPLHPDLKYVMIDKESLNNALIQSHDIHLQAIDSREDLLVSRIQNWVEEYCENIHKEEIRRSRKKVTEIHHFLDLQREEFEDFHIFALDIQASVSSENMKEEGTVSLYTEGEKSEISEISSILPEPTETEDEEVDD